MLRAGFAVLSRRFSSAVTEGEQRLAALLKQGIPGTTEVVVEDVSNGCGSMYSVFVEATSFQGKSTVAQHKMVTGVLREQIKDMHGLSIKTKPSPKTAQ